MTKEFSEKLTKYLDDLNEDKILKSAADMEKRGLDPTRIYGREYLEELKEKAILRNPDDLITLTIALTEFQVSRPTLKRAINDGLIKTYRKKVNSLHMVSRFEVANLYLKR